ncbi:hypothetical protein OG894_00930 [Streptomyces sp. NBC_01724]|uniref:hypothetical protein n=1 Tax=unclassified Streptomyces TaxID=2593676 RepID=UPI002E35A6DE|nr:hypothetical protein [Streptomyces sp. NBC_01724]WTE56608.1 hypothetical protein OG987_41725 [Streptomyces sp. NBC_01620]WTE64680.1 hypothetical protein OG784_41455 [Streptomyces sp. NBC_01617]WTI91969.1 hypothetical protein OHB17_40775 [Streptomyces sp. NBC_00724]
MGEIQICHDISRSADGGRGVGGLCAAHGHPQRHGGRDSRYQAAGQGGRDAATNPGGQLQQ